MMGIALLNPSYACYNFGRIHKSLRVTPAMQAGISDHVWGLEAIAALVPEPIAKKRGAYKNSNRNCQLAILIMQITVTIKFALEEDVSKAKGWAICKNLDVETPPGGCAPDGRLWIMFKGTTDPEGLLDIIRAMR